MHPWETPHVTASIVAGVLGFAMGLWGVLMKRREP